MKKILSAAAVAITVAGGMGVYLCHSDKDAAHQTAATSAPAPDAPAALPRAAAPVVSDDPRVDELLQTWTEAMNTFLGQVTAEPVSSETEAGNPITTHHNMTSGKMVFAHEAQSGESDQIVLTSKSIQMPSDLQEINEILNGQPLLSTVTTQEVNGDAQVDLAMARLENHESGVSFVFGGLNAVMKVRGKEHQITFDMPEFILSDGEMGYSLGSVSGTGEIKDIQSYEGRWEVSAKDFRLMDPVFPAHIQTVNVLVESVLTKGKVHSSYAVALEGIKKAPEFLHIFGQPSLITLESSMNANDDRDLFQSIREKLALLEPGAQGMPPEAAAEIAEQLKAMGILDAAVTLRIEGDRNSLLNLSMQMDMEQIDINNLPLTLMSGFQFELSGNLNLNASSDSSILMALQGLGALESAGENLWNVDLSLKNGMVKTANQTFPAQQVVMMLMMPFMQQMQNAAMTP